MNAQSAMTWWCKLLTKTRTGRVRVPDLRFPGREPELSTDAIVSCKLQSAQQDNNHDTYARLEAYSTYKRKHGGLVLREKL